MAFHRPCVASAVSGMRDFADLCSGAEGAEHLELVYAVGWLPALRIRLRAGERIFFDGHLGVQLRGGGGIGDDGGSADRSFFSAVALEAHRERYDPDACFVVSICPARQGVVPCNGPLF